jgi:Na+/proline symporter/nitrogen-specific signal transduction histidine kinase
MQSGVIVLVSLGYIGLLFAIARYGDKRAEAGRSLIGNPYIYALSMGVYCTAWTFYGSVGRAAGVGLGFLPIYLGPTLMALLWWFVLRKIIRISKVNRITSIADFAASRYGKSTALGGLVTVVAVVGIIPYISLQLKGISISFLVLSRYPNINTPTEIGQVSILDDTAFYAALLLALFAILFGTRHLDATEHHEGLVAAIAFESVVKLIAFLAVGFFVTFRVYHGFTDVFAKAAANPALTQFWTMPADGYGNWAWLVFLSMTAIIFLPRQFHMAVVENVNEHHLNKAIWLFPLYLLVINIFVLPIAFGGLLHFPNGNVDPDFFVLTIPMAEGAVLLAMFVFIGGLSAATSMVIVATVALTIMVSNDLVMPVLLRWRFLNLTNQPDLSWLLLAIRRSAIVLILFLSYGYFRTTGQSQTLVSIGLISFAAVAQFAPAILGGIYWKGGSRIGAMVGLSAGFAVWGYTLGLPSLVESGFLAQSFIDEGPLGLSLLKPYALFGLSGSDPISHAMLWSMLANAGGYVIISLLTSQSVIEHRQANLFVDVFKHSTADDPVRFWRGSARVESLQALLSRFLGQERAATLFEAHARQRGLNLSAQTQADAALVDFVEKQLAGAIGGASARTMVASAVKEEALTAEEVLSILDETSQVIAYSHRLEEKSKELEAATAELRAANERLKELDRLKDDFMSTVTHELRTPLTSIRAFAEILGDNPRLDMAQRQQFYGIILKESERLTRLINNVLDLSKIESGKMEWSVSYIDLKTVLEEALVATGHLFQEKRIRLETRLQDVPSVLADGDRITQVLLNLLSNAIKFCHPEAGWVGINLTHTTEVVRVDISDNGDGIKPEDIHIVFEKFRQVGDTLTDKPQGTGLGLPICRQIISHFGGELWVESQPGQGATFSFTLPLWPPRETLKTPVEPAETGLN